MEQELENVEETKFKSASDDSIIKVDLNKPPVTEQDDKPEKQTEEVTASEADDTGVAGSDENAEPVQEQEEVQPEDEAQEQPVV